MFGSSFASDDEALAEFRAAAPATQGEAVVTPLVCGRRQRRWVKNVVAVGAAAGQLPPLHAPELDLALQQTVVLAQTLLESEGDPTPGQIDMVNRHFHRQFEARRGLAALHLRFNERLETPFWEHCRRHVDVGSAGPLLEFYQDNGPTGYWSGLLLDAADSHPLETYWTILLGLKVPHRAAYQPTAAEIRQWREHCVHNQRTAETAMTCEEVMAIVAAMQGPS